MERRPPTLGSARRKEYASRTPEKALQQFVRRRWAQISILEKQLARAKQELALTEAYSPVFKGPPMTIADGSIVTGRRGRVVLLAIYGDIYLETRRATVAGEFGWEIRGFVRDDLVIMRKGAPWSPVSA